MKKILPILFLALLLVGCDDKRLGVVLTTADSLLVEDADSALRYLEAHEALKPEGSKGQRMRFELLRAMAQNRAYVDFTSDSVMKEVVDYYDHHGTSNDQLQAYYLLGCVYRDLGDAPRAIECFLDAVAKADTTAKDCDYRTVGCVYSQMADMYHSQLLLNNEIEARKQASHYAFVSGDTLIGIYDYKMIAGSYILQSKKDSAEIILKEAMNQYRKQGKEQEALQASTMLMHIYTEQPEHLSELKSLIEEYDAKSELFDESHELPPFMRQYYYYKGMYYEHVNKLDSAEICYRKIYWSGMSYAAKDPMYRGLLSVFQKKQQPDSIAKYATLFAEVNDSSLNLKDQELTAQMTASYNYSLYQKQSQKDAEIAYHANLRFTIILAVTIILLIVLAIIVKTYKVRQKQKQKEVEQLKNTFTDTLELHKEKIRDLQKLEDTHQKVLSLIQQELGKAKEENSTFRKKYSDSQQRIEEINADYEQERARLTEEIQSLKENIETQKRQKDISDHLKNIDSFNNCETVLRIKEMASNPLMKLTLQDTDSLIQATKTYFPTLIHDLGRVRKIQQQSVCVCILVAMDIRTDEIANLLGVSGQRVTNIKASLNEMLFGVNSAKNLYDNLRKHYNVISL